MRQRRPAWLGYGVAVLSVTLAAWLSLMLLNQGLYRESSFTLFYGAVMLSAWVGGLGPGLVATGLTVWIIDYGIRPSFLSRFPAWDSVVQIGTFVLVAAFISWLNAMRQKALDQAKTASDTKDHFLAVLSHELRTPLTPALAAAAMLETDETLPQPARKDMQLIRQSIELEARLIDDLLDLTRISKGKLQLVLRPVPLAGLLDHVMEICRSDMRIKRLNVNAQAPPRDLHVLGDSARLHQVFWNLVKNAVKFTPEEGNITLRTAVDGDWAVVEVIDSGIGIEPAALARIFDAFEQANRAITRRFGGVGLGLTISKALVAAHGGALTARSDGKERGATFTVRLPTTAPPPEPEQSEPHQTASPSPALRLLLVEDHADTARIMVRLLQKCSYDVKTAHTVAAALENAAANRFDLVISDLGLPDGTGFELMKALKEQYGLKGIALSGYGMQEDIQRSVEAGFSAHLAKPVNFQALRAMIEQITS